MTPPIGLGARWADTITQTTEGIELTITIDNELVELTDDIYTVDLAIDDTIDERVEGARLSGTPSTSPRLPAERELCRQRKDAVRTRHRS